MERRAWRVKLFVRALKLASVASLLLLMCGSINATMAIMYVDPARIEVSAGEVFSVDIAISDVTNLYAWEFKLYYQNDILNGTEIVEGAFLKSGDSTFFYVVDFDDAYNASYGRIWVTCTLTGFVTGIFGDGVLATIKFNAVASGTSILALRHTKLALDPEPIEIPHTTSDGLVIVGPRPPPRKIKVPQDYPGIQHAVDEANVGDIISVSAGTYYEHVCIYKNNLTLLGESRESIINGQGKEAVINVTSINVYISGFTITNGTYGIYIEKSSGNIIQENSIVTNEIGILLVSSHENIVKSNEITCNTCGLFLCASDNNIVYHNNFVNNIRQVYVFHSVSRWNDVYPSGGNYWSDYEGMDNYCGPGQDKLGSDEIGDIPYVIGCDNEDHYPLMKPVSNPFGMHDGVGDVNGDGKIDWKDLFEFAGAYGAKYGQPAYDHRCDFNEDYIIDFRDLYILATSYGKE